MKQTTNNWLSVTGLLLALPATYFICISVLKYGLHINEPFDSSAPLFQRWGIKESLGWNINLLILAGPIAGLLLTIFQVLIFNFQFTKEHFQFRFTIRKKWFPILVAAFSASLLAILLFYVLGENCNC